MSRPFIAAALALAVPLGGCAGLALPESPRSAANATVADEQAALGVEVIYQGWATFVTNGVRLGLIRGETAAKVQEYDARIFAVVQLARQAYDAGNAASYAAFTTQAVTIVGEATGFVSAMQGSDTNG